MSEPSRETGGFGRPDTGWIPFPAGGTGVIHTFEAGPWRTNCWIVSDGPGSECFIIDPGMDALDRIRSTIEAQRLKPIAVLLTHGHIDHMFSVLPVADGYGIPALVHGDDRDRLADPFTKMTADTRQMVKALGAHFAEPSDVVELYGGFRQNIAGFDIAVHHAPGHTAGSVLFETVLDQRPTLFSGDVLFAGAIGRTDLAGGSEIAMEHTLRNVILPLPDDMIVHCGHGPSTSIGRERATNPYLRMAN